MNRNAMTALMILALLTIAGCAAIVAGAGAGAGVYSYIAGELKRTYPADFDSATQAAEAALAALKISVTERTSTGIETTLTGMRTDETPVTVTIIMIEPKITEVGVRSGYVGYWDKSGSELIHATIAKRLL